MKSGGPCPYWPQPLLCCRLENEFPGFEAGVTVTVALADLLESPTLAAVMVIVVLAATWGAVNSPVLEIAPAVVAHVTAEFEALLTCALNCFELPVDTVAVAGVTLIATAAFSATFICKDCCLECPFESETATAKSEVPVAVGMPEIAPVVPRRMPSGS